MRIATKVRYCASCHRQDLDKVHVDLDAYYDGPALTNEHDVAEAADKIAVDDLVLCETCLREAGSFIGLVDGEELESENKELGAAVERHLEQVYERDELISDLQKSLAHFTQEKIVRPKRKPRILAEVE